MKKIKLILSIICFLTLFYPHSTTAQIKLDKLAPELKKKLKSYANDFSLGDVKKLNIKIGFIKEKLTPMEYKQFVKDMKALSWSNRIKELKKLKDMSKNDIMARIILMREENSKQKQ